MSTKKKKDKSIGISERCETYKDRHPDLFFILRPLGKLVGFVITLFTIYLAISQGIAGKLGNSIAQASYNLQRLQLERPFFSYAYSNEAGGIVIKHNENINITKTIWVFPTSSTIEKYDYSDGTPRVIWTDRANLRLLEKYDKTLTLNEFYRSYQEDISSLPEIIQSPGALVKLDSYLFRNDKSAFGYLRCQIFPMIQNIVEQKDPGGVLVGVSATYERLDGKVGYTNDILLIRETKNKVPEITVYYRNATEQILRSKLAEFYKKFYGAIKSMPFDLNYPYMNGEDCSQTGWMYTLVK